VLPGPLRRLRAHITNADMQLRPILLDRLAPVGWTQFGPAGPPPPRYEPARPCRAFHPSEELAVEPSGSARACRADLTSQGPPRGPWLTVRPYSRSTVASPHQCQGGFPPSQAVARSPGYGDGHGSRRSSDGVPRPRRSPPRSAAGAARVSDRRVWATALTRRARAAPAGRAEAPEVQPHELRGRLCLDAMRLGTASLGRPAGETLWCWMMHERPDVDMDCDVGTLMHRTRRRAPHLGG
jgi:hypothetical protein